MSDAVQLDRVSQIVGYKIQKGNFSNTTPNLPHRIAIIGEANTANQSTLDTVGKEITSAQQAGQLYGYGSPIHQMMRILRPITSVGVGGIPTIVYPQAVPVGATAKVIDITPTGTATANGTHTIIIDGRNGVDGGNYFVNINTGDDEAAISQKIADVVNDVLGSPVIATVEDTPDKTVLTTKWKGLTANDVNVTVDTGNNTLGITYAVVVDTTGTGTPSVLSSLTQFDENWNTIVVNSYGLVDAVTDELKAYNGIPDEDNPTGRWNGEVFKPFIAITGTKLNVAQDLIDITTLEKDEVTIALAPAPGSNGLSLEAAANMTVLFALQAQNSPNTDVQDKVYNDMPIGDIGDFSDYNERDRMAKNGCSTVIVSNGKYKVKDFVTTYHPVGENPPQFRYPRNINIDWNVRFGELLLVQAYVIGNSISADDDIVDALNVIKPKSYKQLLFSYAEQLARRALIADASFMQDSVTVGISPTNPDRIDTTFSYKRTGFGRIASTTATAGFNFGN